MKRIRFELMIVLAALLLPTMVFAQDDTMSFGEGEEEAAGDDTMSFGEGEEAASEEGAEEATPEEDDAAEDDSADGGDLLSALDEGDESIEGEASAEEETAGETTDERHPIWSVQQVYALRAQRLDFQPSFGFSMNDPYVQHQSVNLAASYYLTEVLAAGLSFNWYRGLDNETDINYSLSRATHQTAPINEYFLGAQLNFSYIPVYGKFAMFKEWIIHWDMWVLGGGGFILTRPIPVIDPEYRTFDYGMKFSFNVGLGLRVYLTKFLGVYAEIRDYIFQEELESLVTYSDETERKDSSKWTDDSFNLTNNVMLNVGISVFLPLSFEYKLPK